MRWLTQPEQDVFWDVKAGSLPLREATAALPVWTGPRQGVEGLQTFVDVLEEARVRPVIEAYPQVSEAIGKAIASVLLGQASPAEALSRRAAATRRNDALDDGMSTVFAPAPRRPPAARPPRRSLGSARSGRRRAPGCTCCRP